VRCPSDVPDRVVTHGSYHGWNSALGDKTTWASPQALARGATMRKPARPIPRGNQSLSRSPLLQPPVRRTRDRRDKVVLVICRSKLPRVGAMATEKATPGAPTTCWGQTPVRGLAQERIYPRTRKIRAYCFGNVEKSGNSLFRSPQRCLIFLLHRLACLKRPRGAAEHASGSELGAKRLASALAELSSPA